MVIKDFPRKRGEAQVRVLCDCGSVKDVTERVFYNSLSCGCEKGQNISASKTRHGKRGHRIYWIWSGMIDRCSNPNNKSYSRYGAKGIFVCSRWLTFDNFYEDMGDPPSSQHSIDRYPNPAGNYEPSNCRWATSQEQARNKVKTIYLTYLGETKCLPEWAETSGISLKKIEERFRRGYSPARVLALGDLRSMRTVVPAAG